MPQDDGGIHRRCAACRREARGRADQRHRDGDGGERQRIERALIETDERRERAKGQLRDADSDRAAGGDDRQPLADDQRSTLARGAPTPRRTPMSNLRRFTS